MLKRHAAAACDSSTVWLPTTIVPDRADGTGFAATLKPTDASPWPLRSPVSDTQLVLVAIVQVQSRDVLMLIVPLPPVAPNDAGELPAATWHFPSEVGPATDVCAELHAVNDEPVRMANTAAKNDRGRIRSTPAPA